jgi:hypothetical protein
MLYLEAPEDGGEIHFPRTNLTLRPRQGDALLYYNLSPTNTPDEMSLHNIKPIRKGELWVVTKWIRERAFEGNWLVQRQMKLWEEEQALQQNKEDQNEGNWMP